jgi:hypothetical protein
MTKKDATPNTALLDKFQEINRTWLGRLDEARQVESEFGAKLMKAKTPSEAMAVCNAWMAKRVELLAQEQREFGTAWADIVSGTVQASFTTAENLARSATRAGSKSEP